MNSVDPVKLDEYISRVVISQSRGRLDKKRILDDIDEINMIDKSSKSAKIIGSSPEFLNKNAISTNYWDSIDVKKLFSPGDDETIHECLIQQVELLGIAIYNNEGLYILVGIKNINEIRSKQRKNIRLRCMYLQNHTNVLCSL